jgi:hypothetical protein
MDPSGCLQLLFGMAAVVVTAVIAAATFLA